MDYEICLSTCSRYVLYRPHVLSQTTEQILARQKELGAFARTHGTNRILVDFSGFTLPVTYKLDETLFKLRPAFKPGRWRFALVSSMGVPTYSNEMVSGYAEILEALGQRAAHFSDVDDAVAWLVAEHGQLKQVSAA